VEKAGVQDPVARLAVPVVGEVRLGLGRAAEEDGPGVERVPDHRGVFIALALLKGVLNLAALGRVGPEDDVGQRGEERKAGGRVGDGGGGTGGGGGRTFENDFLPEGGGGGL